jgi:hypothetical protein
LLSVSAGLANERDMIAFDHADDIEVYREYLRKQFALPVLYNRS